jgi:rhamnosyltransferase
LANQVSVVIPTFDAGPGFEELLRRLDAQRGDFELEVVVVDSGSTDGTAELATRYGAAIHRVPKADFDHGATRDLGVSFSSGEYVALTVQDAVPLDEKWLAAMVENLQKDPRVAAVYGRHVPRPDAGVMTRALVGNLAVADHERREQEIQDQAQYRSLSPAQRRRMAAFDNVSSCLRRSVWEEFPFLRRHYVDQLVLDELFGARTVPNLPRLILGVPHSARHVYGLLRRGEQAPEKKPKLLLDAATYALASQLGAYLGAKVPSISRLSPRLHTRLHRLLAKGV